MGALIAMQICEGVVLKLMLLARGFLIFFGGFKGITSAFTIHGSVSRCCVFLALSLLVFLPPGVRVSCKTAVKDWYANS